MPKELGASGPKVPSPQMPKVPTPALVSPSPRVSGYGGITASHIRRLPVAGSGYTLGTQPVAAPAQGAPAGLPALAALFGGRPLPLTTRSWIEEYYARDRSLSPRALAAHRDTLRQIAARQAQTGVAPQARPIRDAFPSRLGAIIRRTRMTPMPQSLRQNLLGASSQAPSAFEALRSLRLNFPGALVPLPLSYWRDTMLRQYYPSPG